MSKKAKVGLFPAKNGHKKAKNGHDFDNTMPRSGGTFTSNKTHADMARKIIIESICVLFILLFVYAAVSKLQDYPKFLVQLGQSPLLTAYVNWVAWAIPAIEIILSVLLAIPETRLYALYGSFTLMVMFSAYIVAILNFSDYIPCSCGGVLQHMTWTTHLIFNAVFVILGAFGVLSYPPGIKKQSITPT